MGYLSVPTVWQMRLIKFISFEKATQFCEIFTIYLSYVVPVKSKVKISQNFVAFSEYMNFNSQFYVKVKKILKGSLDLIPPSSAKIQIMGRKVCLMYV